MVQQLEGANMDKLQAYIQQHKWNAGGMLAGVCHWDGGASLSAVSPAAGAHTSGRIREKLEYYQVKVLGQGPRYEALCLKNIQRW